MKAKLALLEASPSTSQSSKTSQPKNKILVAKTFDWDEEEVSDDDEEVTQVKVLMALADDELLMEKNHARNDEWIDITIRKVNIILSMDEDADCQNTELTKLNHAFQEKLKEERKVNEKCLTSSKKVSQCINEQIPSQKKKILGGHLILTGNDESMLTSFTTCLNYEIEIKDLDDLSYFLG
uniref:Retrovirus-related Pol polyprotein from transposon TNT 1-94 n=1 Tax=Tanacetum cinerariifolium TaxID=118510 RepID=A0A699I2Z8_TANCI|nr:retrovirus-related Pol polyprotein from transposon TNT 1-94 [Tanacetum cinerariifolium]